MLYHITNTASGADLGFYPGKDSEDAYLAMCRDAGCNAFSMDPDLAIDEFTLAFGRKDGVLVGVVGGHLREAVKNVLVDSGFTVEMVDGFHLASTDDQQLAERFGVVR